MASKYIAKYPLPEDFPDLLHDFTREVLRDQPANIYEYGALYFKAMYMVSLLFKFTKYQFIGTFNFLIKCCQLSARILGGNSLNQL